LTALDQARHGNSVALEALLESFRPYVRMIVRALHKNRLLARVDESNLIQQTLVEANRCFAGFTGNTTAELAGWVRRIVIRTARQALRHLDAGGERASDTLDSLATDDGSTPGAEATRHEEAARLAEVMDRLPEELRQVLLGRHVDELSSGVLAERLGHSERAVRVLYTRALRRLRDEYHER
jgi:RNA polymerase sigma-70 factor (ECF subfamily)